MYTYKKTTPAWREARSRAHYSHDGVRPTCECVYKYIYIYKYI